MKIRNGAILENIVGHLCLEWDYKIRPDSDHVAKFQGDRSRKLGERVAKQKKDTSRVKHKPVRNNRSGRPKKLLSPMYIDHNVLFSGDYISALRGCCPLKFLHALEIDQGLLAHTHMGVEGPPQKN